MGKLLQTQHVSDCLQDFAYDRCYSYPTVVVLVAWVFVFFGDIYFKCRLQEFRDLSEIDDV